MSAPAPPATRATALGLGMATALVIGNMIASGVFLLPSSLAPYGGLSIVAWLITAAGAMLLALVFARLSRAYPAKGGPYAYARRGFGDFAGYLTAWGYWVAAWVGNAAIAIAFAGYVGYFVDPVADEPALAALTALAAIWLLTYVNLLGVRSAGWVATVTTVLKLVPLVLVAGVGVFSVRVSDFQPFNPTGGSAWSGIATAATLTLWAFIGLESATVPADEVRDAERTVPRATVLGTAATALVYLLGTAAVMAVIPPATLQGSTAPFADAAEVLFGSWGGSLVAAGALVSTFGALTGWILLQGQVPQAAARDGLFPEVFGHTNRHGAPVAGLVVSSVLISVLMTTNYQDTLVSVFTRTILIATLATLVPYAISAAAQIRLLVVDPHGFVGAHLFRDGTLALLALAYSLWTIYGAGWSTFLWGVALYAAGVPGYLWILERQRRPHLDEPIPGDRTVLDVQAHDTAGPPTPTG